jgi:hypothetical protein
VCSGPRRYQHMGLYIPTVFKEFVLVTNFIGALDGSPYKEK